MEAFLGEWTLHTSENLDSFLKFYGYSLLSIEIAKVMTVDLRFQPTHVSNEYTRTIESTVYMQSERYIFDGQYHRTPDRVNKKHSFVNGGIESEAHKDGKVWCERITIEEGALVVRRTWNSDLTCTQAFIPKRQQQ